MVSEKVFFILMTEIFEPLVSLSEIPWVKVVELRVKVVTVAFVPMVGLHLPAAPGFITPRPGIMYPVTCGPNGRVHVVLNDREDWQDRVIEPVHICWFAPVNQAAGGGKRKC